MVTFTYTPPTVNDVPPVDATEQGPAYRLMRHFGTRPRGQNVWRLIDGRFTLTQPYPTISVADAAREAVDDSATYIDVFYGGHVYDSVSSTDALQLQADGVGAIGVDLFPNGFTLPSGTGLLLTSSGGVLIVTNSEGIALLELA